MGYRIDECILCREGQIQWVINSTPTLSLTFEKYDFLELSDEMTQYYIPRRRYVDT